MSMRSRNLLRLILFATIACAFIIHADPLDELLGKLEHFRKNYPQEKIHLHLDKPFYSVGDTIFFKAYVVNAEKNNLSRNGALLYVDLVNEHNEIKKSFTWALDEGITSGDIGLSSDLGDGKYRLRSYTNWMKNFPEDYFFDQYIIIGDALNSEVTSRITIEFGDEDDEKAEAAIHFSFIKGGPVSNRNIEYAILLDEKERASGNTKTNGNGIAHITLPPMPKAATGAIMASIKLNDKATVTKKILFNASYPKPDIQFFPEGGELVNGLPSRVGFKSVGPDGLGLNVNGSVVDDKGNKITDFSSAFAGIGSFSFTPLEDSRYFALILVKGGITKKLPLPQSKEQGYMLSVDGVSDKEKLVIKIGGSSAGVDKEVILVAQSNNVVHYTAKSRLTKEGIRATLLKKRFPTGILHVSLFDAAYQPVAERLVFINHDDGLKMKVTSAKKIYNQREKVKLDLEVKDDKGDPVVGSFSIAVTDAGKLPVREMSEKTIHTNLLLTADLRGFVEVPNYYFTDVNSATICELDNLLLTQRWRRFTWKDIIAKKYPDTIYHMQKYPGIHGKVVTSKGEAVKSGKVTLLVRGSEGGMLQTLTNNEGLFSFNDLRFSGNVSFTLQAVDARGNKNLKIQLQETGSPISRSKFITGVYSSEDSAFYTYLKNSAARMDVMKQQDAFKEATLLKEVSVKATKLSKLAEAVEPSANLNGAGNADQVITYEDLRNCTGDFANCLGGKLRGVVIRNHLGKFFAYSTRTMQSPQTPMLLVVDGINQQGGVNGTSLNNIQAHDVQSVEVLRSIGFLSIYGMQGQGGVLVITTKRGGIDYNAGSSPQNAADVFSGTLNGYAISREFYSPDYSIQKDENIPDLRSTIFWKPHMITGDDGKASVEFYNADGKGAYKVIIEGISAEGKLGRATYAYQVE